MNLETVKSIVKQNWKHLAMAFVFLAVMIPSCVSCMSYRKTVKRQENIAYHKNIAEQYRECMKATHDNSQVCLSELVQK